MNRYLRIQTSSDQYFQQLSRPVISTIWISHNLFYDIFHDLQQSLKYPEPYRCSNRHINSTYSQIHENNTKISSWISPSETASNNTRLWDIAMLTYTNCDKWPDNKILVLSAKWTYAIITGDNPKPQPFDFDYDDYDDDWKVKTAKAGPIIGPFCSPEVQHTIKGIRNPHKLWNRLATSLDSAGSSIGRQDILCLLHTCRPKEDTLLHAYFTKYSNRHIQLDQPDDAINNHDCWIRIFTSLPS